MSIPTTNDCYVAGRFMLKNFQGHVLDLAGQGNPVITWPQNDPQTTNQMWTWGPSESGWILANVFNGLSIFYNPNYSEDPIGPTYMQLFASPTGTSGGFQLNCTSTTSGSFTWVNTNLALTSWGTQTGDNAAPVTLEVYTGRAEQTWTVVDLD